MKPLRAGRWYLATVVVILLLTAAMKLVTLVEAQTPDDVRKGNSFLTSPAPYAPGLTNGHVMLAGAVLEFIVVGLLLRLAAVRSRLAVVAWVGGVFAAYHIGLGLMGYQLPCGCLGGPMPWLHLPKGAYDAITTAIIVYLLVGSYGFLLWETSQKLRTLRIPLKSMLRGRTGRTEERQ